MSSTEVTKRLTLSRQVIHGWREAGGPIGSPEDLMRMIGEEIATLERLAVEHPAEAENIGFLVVEYAVLRERVRKQSN